MTMKRSGWETLLILATILSACARNTAEPAATAEPRPSQNADGLGSGTVFASAVVVPAHQAQMGFLMAATVGEIPVVEGEQVSAGQRLIVLNTPELQASVEAAEAALRSAQAEAKYWIYPRNEPPERRQVANAQLRQAEAGLEAARAALAQATGLAPFDGTVVAINIAPGELVQPGQVVLVMGDLDDLQLETTDLGESFIAGLRVGQAATVRFKAFDQDFSGRVAAIAPMGEPSGGDILYRVTIELDDPPVGLMWGMSADVEIQSAP
jgi:HlyD family secretion protein